VPRVLHVLPHPGGGGEVYADLLSQMDGFSFEKVYIAGSARPTPRALVGGVLAQLSTRRFDLMHVHGEVASALSLPMLALRPSVVTMNGLHLLRRAEGWRRSAAVANLRLVVRAASATVCVSESEAADVAAAAGRRRVVLIHNGIEPLPQPTADERRVAREELDLPAADVIGVFIAALDPHKEPLVAANAAVEVRGDGTAIRLLFAGEGPLRPELEALELETEAVRVLGFRGDVPRVLAAADFFVLPSTREGLSFALLEAMSIGLPPVVSDAPGNRDAVGDAGLVVPHGDAAGFADAFRRLAVDGGERERLGSRARRRVVERFDRATMVERTREVYERVL
jgi:glycosyltransferase involved in cell wall biosynthesis